MSNDFINVKTNIENMPKEVVINPSRDKELSRLSELLKLYVMHTAYLAREVILETKEEFDFNETQVDFLIDSIERKVLRMVLDDFTEKMKEPPNHELLQEMVDSGLVKAISNHSKQET